MRLRIPFRHRLDIYVSVLFFLFALVVFISQYQRERLFREQSLMNSLIAYADRVDNDISQVSSSLIATLPVIKEMEKKEVRITIIDLNGKVLFDSDAPSNTISDNHAARTEIQMAREKGVGYSIRKSSTLLQPYFYAAKFYGNRYIRASLAYNASTKEILSINKEFFILLIGWVILVFVLLFRYTRRLGKNISQLREFTARAEKDRSVDYSMKFTDDDIGRISRDIVQIYKRLINTRNELSIEKEKLYIHLLNSKEGLAVFDSSKQTILSNSLFIQYLNIISDSPVNSPNQVLALPEFASTSEFISSHLQQTEQTDELSDETMIEKNGKSFEVKTILFHDRGFEISINNVTQEVEEARLKRQLTQNISHELKTPVSSIQGFLETILNTPDLDEEMKRSFLRKSYDQTVRLVDLLSDISTLNRLDEAARLYDLSELSLASIIRDACNDVALPLKEKQMKVSLRLGSDLPIHGNQSLLYSIFRNLLDNAIAYSGEGTEVCINCYLMNNEYYFINFSDTGVGIPREHLNRVFERFYRVDKGRSRKLGGTGLGLAIVKNAVLFHKGEISVKNRTGGGLEFIFTLRRK